MTRPDVAIVPRACAAGILLAAAAAANLLDDWQGRPGQARFKVELVCIVDALDQGTLIWRTAKRNLLLPPSRLLHWAKRAFERLYLSRYR